MIATTSDLTRGLRSAHVRPVYSRGLPFISMHARLLMSLIYYDLIQVND